jgi:hypothetical protein
MVGLLPQALSTVASNTGTAKAEIKSLIRLLDAFTF